MLFISALVCLFFSKLSTADHSLDAVDGSPRNAVYVDNIGRVGIGTQSPLSELHVVGRGNLLVGNDDKLLILSPDENSGERVYFSYSDSGTFKIGIRTHYFYEYGPIPSNFTILSSKSGYVGIGIENPSTKLHVKGMIYSESGGFKFPDGSVQTTAATGGGGGSGFSLPYTGSISTSSNAFSITNTRSTGTALYAKGGPSGYAADFQGKVRIKSWSSGATVMELGEGLDVAEGFNVSDQNQIKKGSVLIIDSANPGKLAISEKAYDTKVAGIVAGANGLGSGVRLGAGQFDYDVALAGRVYCHVDATTVAVEPGDLLTTSDTPGYAMKAVDYDRARGAILGKAMEKLEKGEKGQILVLVTLQ